MSEGEKLKFIGGYFSEDWAVSAALVMLDDYERAALSQVKANAVPLTPAPGELTDEQIDALLLEQPSESEMLSWGSMVVSIETCRAAVRAALAQQDKDAARLDFLDAMNARKNKNNGTTYGWEIEENHNRIAITDCNYPALSIRAAIDAAIAAKGGAA